MRTIQEVLVDAVRRLSQAGQENARLDAQVVLSYVLDVERRILFVYPEREVTEEQEQRFSQLVERRAHGEPVAYLTGHKEFYGLDFVVDRRVLIPRPETELLVEVALGHARRKLAQGAMPVVADIGTGSGAIPIALAVEEPKIPYLYACDISSDALDIARLNSQRHSVEARIRLLQGDLLSPLPEPVDILTANLPYVGLEEMAALERDVRAFEPHLALFSGPEGLDLLLRFCREAKQTNRVKTGTVMLLEIGYQQREALTALLLELWPESTVTSIKDYSGWDRIMQMVL